MTTPVRKTALRCVAVAAVLATLLGAESGCEVTGNEGQTHTTGNDLIYGACEQSTVQPTIAKKGASIVTYVTSVCDKAVERHNLTVRLEKRDANGVWSVVKSKDDDRAPGIRQTKKVEVAIGCAPGVYRTTFRIGVLVVGDDSYDQGSGEDNRGVVVTKDNC